MVPRSMLTPRVLQNTGDALAGVITIGVLGDWVPVILGLLGIAWFGLRFVNFIRVNYLGKDSWEIR